MTLTPTNTFLVTAANHNTTLTSPSFTPATNDIIVVKAAFEDSQSGFGTPTATGGGITFTLRRSDTSSSHCPIYIWTGIVTAGGSAITVSLASTGSVAQQHSMMVEQWDGTTCQLAATPASTISVGSGTATTSLTTGAAGSVISWLNADWAALSPTSATYANSATSEGVHNVSPNNYVAYYNYQQAASAGANTFGVTSPTGQTYSLAGIEIQAKSTGTPATVTAVKATATAAAAAPAIKTGASVSAVKATATASSTAPVIRSGATVTAVKAAASAAAPAPVVKTGATVSAVKASASAAAPAPAIKTGATITAVKATATAAVPAPAVSTGGAVVIQAVKATASASVKAPLLSIPATVHAVAATASAAVRAPAVTAGGSATVQAVRAAATASVRAPTVSAGGAVTVHAVAATATATSPAPLVRAGMTLQAVRAAATASVRAPVVYIRLEPPHFSVFKGKVRRRWAAGELLRRWAAKPLRRRWDGGLIVVNIKLGSLNEYVPLTLELNDAPLAPAAGLTVTAAIYPNGTSPTTYGACDYVDGKFCARFDATAAGVYRVDAKITTADEGPVLVECGTVQVA